MYWLTDFPLINSWVCLKRIIVFILKRYTLVTKKQANKYKEKISNFTVDRDHKKKGSYLFLQIF